MSDFSYTESYTLIKNTIEDDEVKNTLTYEFEELSLPDVLEEMVTFLRACGFDYVDSLVATQSNGKEVSSEDNIKESMDIIFNFDKLKADIADLKDYRKKPDLTVVNNDNEDKE